MDVIDRCELETAITSEVRNLKASELLLQRKFRELESAPVDARVEFLKSVWELEYRATVVEQLIQTLDETDVT